MGKLRWLLAHLEEALGALLLLGMAVLAFANVLTRYFLHLPLAFTEELEINALVWLTLFGTAAAFRRGRHLRLTFFEQRLPPAARRPLRLLLAAIAIGLFASLGYLGYRQLLDERLLEITSESLSVPQWWYTLCIPAGCTLIICRIIEATLGSLRERR